MYYIVYVRVHFLPQAYISFQFLAPQILNLIIAFVEDPEAPAWKGYTYAIALTAVTLVGAVCDSNYWNYLQVSGMESFTMI